MSKMQRVARTFFSRYVLGLMCCAAAGSFAGCQLTNRNWSAFEQGDFSEEDYRTTRRSRRTGATGLRQEVLPEIISASDVERMEKSQQSPRNRLSRFRGAPRKGLSDTGDFGGIDSEKSVAREGSVRSRDLLAVNPDLSNGALSGVIDTSTPSEIDTELSALPPQLRNLLNRQLAATQDFRNQGDSSADPLADRLTDEDAREPIRDGGVQFASFETPTTQESPTPKKHQSSHESSGTSSNISDQPYDLHDNPNSPTPSVRIRLSDNDSDSEDVNAQKKTDYQPEVATANFESTGGMPETVDSRVQHASATMALRVKNTKDLQAYSELPGLDEASDFIDSEHLIQQPFRENASESNTDPIVDQESFQNAERDWMASLNSTIQALENQLTNSPPADENIRLYQESSLRMMRMLYGDIENAMDPIHGLTTEEREYFRYQLQALHEAISPDSTPVRSRRWSVVLNSQREAAKFLSAVSNLDIPDVAFCSEVASYANYRRFDNYQFEPDQDVLLYCELDNVFAEAIKDGYETQIQGSYEIIDSSGRRVADQLLPMEKEICQSARRDYFIVYHIYMPQQIASGNYQMRLTIEDMKARKFGQATLDFQIR